MLQTPWPWFVDKTLKPWDCRNCTLHIASKWATLSSNEAKCHDVGKLSSSSRGAPLSFPGVLDSLLVSSKYGFFEPNDIMMIYHHQWTGEFLLSPGQCCTVASSMCVAEWRLQCMAGSRTPHVVIQMQLPWAPLFGIAPIQGADSCVGEAFAPVVHKIFQVWKALRMRIDCNNPSSRVGQQVHRALRGTISESGYTKIPHPGLSIWR